MRVRWGCGWKLLRGDIRGEGVWLYRVRGFLLKLDNVEVSLEVCKSRFGCKEFGGVCSLFKESIFVRLIKGRCSEVFFVFRGN